MPAPKSKPTSNGSAGSNPADGTAAAQHLDEPAQHAGEPSSTDGDQIANVFFRPLEPLGQLLDRGRDQLEAATKKARSTEPVDRIVRTADRARRTVGVGPTFPILGYDDLTAAHVVGRLGPLTPPQLRKVRDYERRHANRKTVLEAIEAALL
jgi:hypothetical protein